MDKSSKLKPAAIKAQSRDAVQKLEQHIEKLQQAKKLIREFVDDTEIKSKSFDALKRQLGDELLVVDALIGADEDDIADHHTLINTVGDIDLNGNGLLAMLDDARKARDEAQQGAIDARYQANTWRFANPEFAYQWDRHASRLDQEADMWHVTFTTIQARIDFYDQVESTTSSLFISGAAKRSTAKVAVTEMKGCFKNGVYHYDKNAQWRVSLEKIKPLKMDSVTRAKLLIKILDPYTSLLIDPGDRELAVQFLEEEMRKRGGKIDLLLLDYNNVEDLAVYNAIVKLISAHGMFQGDMERMRYRFDALIVDNGIDGSDFGDVLEFDEDILNAVDIDSAQKYKDVQNGTNLWQEKHIRMTSIGSDVTQEIAKLSLIVAQSEMAVRESSPQSSKKTTSKGTGGAKPLTSSELQHIKKHSFEGMSEQAKYLNDSQLQTKLNNTTFFNKNWSMEEVSQYTQQAYDSLIDKGITNGTHQVVIQGETMNIALKDGVFKTAFGNYKFNVSDFR